MCSESSPEILLKNFFEVDPLLLQSFLEDRNEDAAKELGNLSTSVENSLLLGQDQVTSTTTNIVFKQTPESMGYSYITDKKGVVCQSTSIAPQVTTMGVHAVSSPVSSTIHHTPSPTSHLHPSPAPPTPHSMAPSPYSSRSPSAQGPLSASPLPPHTPSPAPSWSPSPVTMQSSAPSRNQSTPTGGIVKSQQAPMVLAPPQSRSTVVQIIPASARPCTISGPRLIQPKQPQILPKPSGTTQSQFTAPLVKPTVTHAATLTANQRTVNMSLNASSASPQLVIGQSQAAGMFPGTQGTILLNQYIPGLGQSPIFIQGSLGQIQSVQLALRPQQPGTMAAGPQPANTTLITALQHQGQVSKSVTGHPTLVIPTAQNLNSRPNIILAPRMVSALPFAIAPGQPLTLQQLQTMLPQQVITQPISAFSTQPAEHHHHHQPIVHIPAAATAQTFAQPVTTAEPHIQAAPHIITQQPQVQHQPQPPQPLPQPQQQPQQQHQHQPQPTIITQTLSQNSSASIQPATSKPSKGPSVNLAELLKQHGIMPESTPPPSPTSQSETTVPEPVVQASTNTPTIIAPHAPHNCPVAAALQAQQAAAAAAVSEVSLQPTPTVQKQPQLKISLAPDGSIILRPQSPPPPPPPSPAPVVTSAAPVVVSQSPQLTVNPTPASSHSTGHSALLERLNIAPPVSVPDLMTLTMNHHPHQGSVVSVPSSSTPVIPLVQNINNGIVPITTSHLPQSFVTVNPPTMIPTAVSSTPVSTVTNVITPTVCPNHVNHVVLQHIHVGGGHTCQGHVIATTSTASATTSSPVISVPVITSVVAPSQSTSLSTTTTPALTNVVMAAPQVVSTSATSAVSVPTNNIIHTHTCPKHQSLHNQQIYQKFKHEMTELMTKKNPSAHQQQLLQQMIAVQEKMQESKKANPVLCATHASEIQQKAVAAAVAAAQAMAATSSAQVSISQPTKTTVPTCTITTTVSSQPVVSHTHTHQQVVSTATVTSDPATKLLQTSNQRCPSPPTPTGLQLVNILKEKAMCSAGTNQVLKLTPQQQHQLHQVVHHQVVQHQHQQKMLRCQQPNHVAPTMKQITVEVPVVTPKQPLVKNVSPVPVKTVASTPEPPKTLCPPEPPKPPPPVSKPPVPVPVPVPKMHLFHKHLAEDQCGAINPDIKKPFATKEDACKRLLSYHVFNNRVPSDQDLAQTDELFAEVSQKLLEKRQRLFEKFQYLLLLEGMRDCPTAEKLMVEKLFVEDEFEALKAKRQAVDDGEDIELPSPRQESWQKSSTSEERPPSVSSVQSPQPLSPSSPLSVNPASDLGTHSVPLSRHIKKEPLDQEQEPAAKRQARLCNSVIKKEDNDKRWCENGALSALRTEGRCPFHQHEPTATMITNDEEEDEELATVPTANDEHDDIMSTIRKELNISPLEQDDNEPDATHVDFDTPGDPSGFADFEPPVARTEEPPLFTSSLPSDLKFNFLVDSTSEWARAYSTPSENKLGVSKPPASVSDILFEPREGPEPELDLSGIEGLGEESRSSEQNDPDSDLDYTTDYHNESSGREQFEDMDEDNTELHSQVQSAINSILDFQPDNCSYYQDGEIHTVFDAKHPKSELRHPCADQNAVDLDADLSMDGEATNSESDPALDEAVRSILL